MSVRQFVNRFFKSKSANVAMIAGLSMPLVVGSGGLAMDTIQWTLWKRQLQRAADSAALAGAFAKVQSKDFQASATADLARTRELTFSATPTIITPTSGAHAGDPTAVFVKLQASRRLPFSGMFMTSVPIIDARATAAAQINGRFCMQALDTSTNPGITMQGNATVTLGCGIVSNTRGSNAVVAGGSSSITATPVAAVGGLSSSSNYGSGTTLLPYSLPQPDPYANLPTPTAAKFTPCSNQVTVQPNSSQTLGPGCYRGMNLKGNVTLSPGTYYIDGSSFSLGSQAVVSGTGVTIVLTSSTIATNPSSAATLSMNGGAQVNLTAPTSVQVPSQPYTGILFYQDPRASTTGANQANGNSSSVYQGAMYFPRQELDFSGTSGMNTNCLQIVARTIVFIGNSTVTNVCPGGPGGFVGARVMLVG